MSAKELLEQAPNAVLPDPAFGERNPLPPKHPEVPTLPPVMVPAGLRVWLTDAAARMCIPLEMVTVPALVALSGLVGRSVSIRPREYSNWTVAPNLWGAIVGPPGAKKSEILNESLQPLAALEAKARCEHQAAQLEAKADQALLEAKLSEWKQKARKGKGNKGDYTELLGKLEALETVPEKRYTTQDTTVEKLGELLRDNPRGIIVTRDELASWIASMESQESAVARGFFLTAWNGISGYTFDRIGRGKIHIPAACVSIIGGIQPQPLQAAFDRLRRDPTRADGMLQRFQLLVWPDGMPAWDPPLTWPDKEARDRAFEIFAKLDSLEFRSPDSGDLEPYLLRFTNEAGQKFAKWHDAHERRLRDQKLENFPHFHAHVAKYGSLTASLAALFHLAAYAADSSHWAFNGQRWESVRSIPDVSLEATLLALDWVDFLELHARKTYGSELNGAVLVVHALAQKILEGRVQDGCTVRSISKAEWAGLRDSGQVQEALQALEGLGWLKVVELETGGRPSEVVRLHPELREGQQ